MYLLFFFLFLTQDALNEGKLPSSFKLLGLRGAEEIEHHDQEQIIEKMSHNYENPELEEKYLLRVLLL